MLSKTHYILILLLIMNGTGCNRKKSQLPQQNKPVITFRLATVNTPSNRGWQAANLIKQQLEKKSNGQIQVLFYDSGVLGAERQILESCYFGVIEMVLCTSSVVTDVDPLYGLLDLPYLFTSKSHQQAVINGPIGNEFLNSLNNYKLQGLAFYALGMRHLFNTKGVAIRTPEDLQGLKIRVMESSVMLDSINAMGASATPLSHSELFQALKTGVVDGAENNPIQFVAAKYYEADCKNFSLTRHFANQIILIANRDWLENIRQQHPQLYKLIRQVPIDIIPEYNRLWDEGVRQAFDQMKTEGVVVNDIDNLTPFIDRVQPVYDDFFQKHPDIPRNWINRIRNQADK